MATVKGVSDPVPWPYGAWDLFAMDGAGAWVADVVDFSRFLLSFDGAPEYPDLLSPASVALSTECPDAMAGYTTWYGMGLWVEPTQDGLVVSHSGALQGTSTVFKRFPDGYTFVLFYNSNPEYPYRGWTNWYQYDHLWDIIDAVREYGNTIPGFRDQDLFPNYQ